MFKSEKKKFKKKSRKFIWLVFTFSKRSSLSITLSLSISTHLFCCCSYYRINFTANRKCEHSCCAHTLKVNCIRSVNLTKKFQSFWWLQVVNIFFWSLTVSILDRFNVWFEWLQVLSPLTKNRMCIIQCILLHAREQTLSDQKLDFQRFNFVRMVIFFSRLCITFVFFSLALFLFFSSFFPAFALSTACLCLLLALLRPGIQWFSVRMVWSLQDWWQTNYCCLKYLFERNVHFFSLTD